jgi:uncharacterized membrane protein
MKTWREFPELWMLAAATASFIIVHVGVASTPLRAALLRRLGEQPYRGLYSLLALATLVWAARSFAAAPHVFLWVVPPALKLLPAVLMPMLLFFLVAGVTTANPAGLAAPGKARSGDPARGILRVTRHPVQWAILVWALLHVGATGHLAALIFFGGLALLAGAGTMLIDRRRRASLGAPWERFASVTSNVPFAAILAGRNRLAWREIGWLPAAGAAVLYLALLAFHAGIFGKTPY